MGSKESSRRWEQIKFVSKVENSYSLPSFQLRSPFRRIFKGFLHLCFPEQS